MPPHNYPGISLAVDLGLFTVLEGHAKLLLVSRGGEPFKGSWALPGGFLEAGETLEEAARRELAEETGAEVQSLLRGPVFDAVDRDPRGRVISVPHAAVARVDEAQLSGRDDAAEARLFPLDALPQRLAFDHADVITSLRDLLRDHLDDPRLGSLSEADRALLRAEL